MTESLNMEISLSKTKSLSISRNKMKCEVKLKGTMIEQVPKFNYLGAEISAKRDLKQEVRVQATKGAGISGCLYNTICQQNVRYAFIKPTCALYWHTHQKQEQKQLMPNNFSGLRR